MLFLIVLPFAFNSMHSNGKGMSSSAMPYKRTAPSWCKTTGTEVVDQVPALAFSVRRCCCCRLPRAHAPRLRLQICKLARKGSTPSQIGVVLRDTNGIPQVSTITGSKILRILKTKG